jgi:hypothetical protein
MQPQKTFLKKKFENVSEEDLNTETGEISSDREIMQKR